MSWWGAEFPVGSYIIKGGEFIVAFFRLGNIGQFLDMCNSPGVLSRVIKNLLYIRKFYLTFPICDALRHESHNASNPAIPNFNALRRELTWTHYRALMRVENPEAREWYMKEVADQNWSTPRSRPPDKFSLLGHREMDMYVRLCEDRMKGER